METPPPSRRPAPRPPTAAGADRPDAVISTQIVRHIRDCFHLAGLDTAALLERCGIDPATIDDPDRTIALGGYLRFFESAALAAGNPHFGLHAARLMGVDGLGALSFLFLSAPTLRAAFRAFTEHLSAMQEATFNGFVEGDRASHFTYHVPHRSFGSMRQDAEYSIAVMHQLMRRYTDNRAHPAEVHFEHQRVGDYRLYEDYFGCTVLFEQDHNRIHFDSALLDLSSTALARGMYPIATAYLKARLHPGDGAASLSQRVRDLIQPAALADLPTLDAVAARLKLSRSALIRALAREGTRYGRLVTERRMDFARTALQQDGRSVTDIALAAGYAESASFCRAFAAHHGETPGRWRRRRHQGD